MDDAEVRRWAEKAAAALRAAGVENATTEELLKFGDRVAPLSIEELQTVTLVAKALAP